MRAKPGHLILDSPICWTFSKVAAYWRSLPQLSGC